jgi:anti-sigma regulatory factor (Ser/Thr protein kinase)
MTIEDALRLELSSFVSPLAVTSIVRTLPEGRFAQPGTLDMVRAYELHQVALHGVRLFHAMPPPDASTRLHRAIFGGRPPLATRMVINIRSDHDVLVAQSAAQRMMKGLYHPTDVVRVATAVSELSRNIYMYAGSGEVVLELSEDRPGAALFRITAQDHGPGIKDLEAIMLGTYRSTTGLGRGLKGCKALLDDLEVVSGPNGTTVRGQRRSRLLHST